MLRLSLCDTKERACYSKTSRCEGTAEPARARAHNVRANDRQTAELASDLPAGAGKAECQRG
jgi:hypothetical protein